MKRPGVVWHSLALSKVPRTAVFVLLLCFSLCSQSAWSKEAAAGIDEVFDFRPGSGQNLGQDAVYYPANIYGPPAPEAGESVPAILPTQILSLGLGGEIIVGFRDAVLVDGPGPDFTVFENAFAIGGTDRSYAEPAKVAVSSDGLHFIEFPFDPWTLTGCAGVTPTNGSADPYDPAVSGGNSFDLATLGLERIRFIKITDITELVLADRQHPFWDPTLSGFDLDAVVGLHLVSSAGERSAEPRIALRNDVLELRIPCSGSEPIRGRCKLYTLDGRLLQSLNFATPDLSLPLGIRAQGVIAVALWLNDRWYGRAILGQ